MYCWKKQEKMSYSDNLRDMIFFFLILETRFHWPEFMCYVTADFFSV